MTRQAVILADGFIGHLNYLEMTRSKMEGLLSGRIIVRRDIEQVYAGLYLEAITSLEDLVENLFIGLLVGRIVHGSPRVVSRVSFQSDLVARDVVLGGRQYVDWFPYHYTERRAKAFFRNGLPFTQLQARDKTQIERLLYVRNAIAHKSSHAKRMFEQVVIGSLPLTPREKTPTGFLRSTFRAAPTQTRYENLVAEMAQLAMRLCI